MPRFFRPLLVESGHSNATLCRDFRAIRTGKYFSTIVGQAGGMLRVALLLAALFIPWTGLHAGKRDYNSRFYECSATGPVSGAGSGTVSVSRTIDLKREMTDEIRASWSQQSPNEVKIFDPEISGAWDGEDIAQGRFYLSFSTAPGTIGRAVIGGCRGDQDTCSPGFRFMTGRLRWSGSIHGSTNWGAVISIGKVWGELYLQRLDEAEQIATEVPLKLAALLAVEDALRPLFAETSEQANDAAHKCQPADPIVLIN